MLALAPFCIIRLMRRTDALPRLQWTVVLPKEASERALGFQSARRRADFLWSRLLLWHALRGVSPAARLLERAPMSPLIESEIPLFCSISHTRTFLGIALSDRPVALDLEVLDAKRPLEPVFRRCFTPLCWDAIPEAGRVRFFYDLWGMRECAVKLPGCIDLEGEVPLVRDASGKVVRRVHQMLPDKTLLTYVGGGEVEPDMETLEVDGFSTLLERETKLAASKDA